MTVRAPLIAGLIGLICVLCTSDVRARELRVCADPNNLPFSNERQQGFENRIVDIIAQELGATVKYVWWAQRRGNVRNTLNAHLCDLIPGVATQLEMLATTRPYYRSTYVFLTREDRGLAFSGLDDERLRQLTIGVQMIGDDFSNTPPAHALARRGIVDNVRGYMLYGDYAQDSPPRMIVDDVARGTLDVALVWGPLAGYFARQQSTKMRLQNVQPERDGPALPMTFEISIGVRRKDRDLKQALEAALERTQPKIETVLASYGVPLLPRMPEPSGEIAANSPDK